MCFGNLKVKRYFVTGFQSSNSGLLYESIIKDLKFKIMFLRWNQAGYNLDKLEKLDFSLILVISG